MQNQIKDKPKGNQLIAIETTTTTTKVKLWCVRSLLPGCRIFFEKGKRKRHVDLVSVSVHPVCAQKVTKSVWSVLSYLFNISVSQRDAEDSREKSSLVSPPLIFHTRDIQTKHCTWKLAWSLSLLGQRANVEAQRWLESKVGAGSEDGEHNWWHLKAILQTRPQLRVSDQFHCSGWSRVPHSGYPASCS